MFQGNFSSTTGAVTLAMMLLGGVVFEKYGWGTAAKATPIVLLVTGVGLMAMSTVDRKRMPYVPSRLTGFSGS